MRLPTILLVLCATAACRKAPPPPKPAGMCDTQLTGVWLNASDRHFAYRFRDHGEVIRGEYLQRTDDGALHKPDDPVLFELHRTDTALAGVMRMTLQNEAGRKCPVEFGIKVSSCQPDAVQAVVETAADVNDDCSRKDGQPQLVEYRFERDKSSDGGTAPD